jgi:hypothetical protein
MRSDRTITGSSAGLGVVLLSAALAGHAVAGGEPVQSSNAAAAPVAAGDGVRAFRDPVTGELRAPTAEERAAMKGSDGARKAREPLAVKAHGGGMVSAVVGTRPLDELIAQRDASGQLVVRHRAEAEALPSAPTASKREDR